LLDKTEIWNMNVLLNGICFPTRVTRREQGTAAV
jgi:hypothetical protein